MMIKMTYKKKTYHITSEDTLIVDIDAYGEEIKQLQDALDKLRWIFIGEGLPKEVGKYDVYDGITKWEEYFSKFEDGEMRWMRRNLTITHWRLIILPEADNER